MIRTTREELEALGLAGRLLDEGGRSSNRGTDGNGQDRPVRQPRQAAESVALNAGAIAGRAQVIDPATGLNKTETAFRVDVLEPLLIAGLILRVDPHAEGLRIGHRGRRCVYWPDFRIVWLGGLIAFVDVKGGGAPTDDAIVKGKTAAVIHPYRFHIATRAKPRDPWTFRDLSHGPGWREHVEQLAAAGR